MFESLRPDQIYVKKPNSYTLFGFFFFPTPFLPFDVYLTFAFCTHWSSALSSLRQEISFRLLLDTKIGGYFQGQVVPGKVHFFGMIELGWAQITV